MKTETCAHCYTKTAADGSWTEEVKCALHMAPVQKKDVRYFRVAWTEQYEKVFEAESEDDAIENRDDDNAFVECSEVSAQEVLLCEKCSGAGIVKNKEIGGWDDCPANCDGGYIDAPEASNG